MKISDRVNLITVEYTFIVGKKKLKLAVVF